MLKKIGKVLLVGIALLVFAFIALGLMISVHENQTKKLLNSELAMLPPPPSCHILSKDYETGGLDTVSTWYGKYGCQTTGKAAYDYMISNLTKRGYAPDQDYSQPSPDGNFVFYSFTYSSKKFTAEYEFNPDSNQPDFSNDQKSMLEQYPVDTISYSLTRNLK